MTRGTIKKGERSFGGLAILTAITASLCCIAPLSALIAGLGGVASSFSWIGPYRPYLIGITVVILAFAWYQKLKPSKDIDCECEEDKPSFLQTRTFLGIITVFAGLMLGFPSYSNILFPAKEVQNTQMHPGQLETALFKINGMTCTGCEDHISHAVFELEGIQKVEASYVKGNAKVVFDKTLTNKESIGSAIIGIGYEISD